MKTALLRRDYAVRSAHWFALLPGDGGNRTVPTLVPGMALPFPPHPSPHCQSRKLYARILATRNATGEENHSQKPTASARLSGSRSGTYRGLCQTYKNTSTIRPMRRNA
jgi:hypothetical protein